MKFACTILICCLCGCGRVAGHAKGVTADVNDVAGLTAELQQQIPEGTELAVAKEFMESEGFRCSLKRQSTFRYKVVNRDGPASKHVIEDSTFYDVIERSNVDLSPRS